MSAVLIVASDPPAVLPSVVRQKITEFLAAGHTGQIVLDVKEGRILAYKLTEAGRVAGDRLDDHQPNGQDSRQTT